MFNNIFFIINIWLILELCNWFLYLLIYVNIANPKLMKLKEEDIQKIIKRIDDLTKDEIEYVLKGCIIYDKKNHKSIDTINLEINNLSNIEIINLIGYSLFGQEIDDYLYKNNKLLIIKNIILKLENKLGYKFINNNNNRYLYRKWGSNFINFSIRPLCLQIPIRLLVTLIHYYFIILLGFKYKINNKIGFMYNLSDPKKDTLIFIHGFGFGYIPFIDILKKLNQQYNLIIVILPNISSYNYYDDLNFIYFPPLNKINNTIYNFLEENKQKNIILLAHSFGTYITQILRKDNRQLLFKKIIMVDPIIFWIGCFKMSIYIDKPSINVDSIQNIIWDHTINYLIYQCLYLKFVCYRVMFGPDFLIYDSNELNNTNITIILEKNDYIIPAELLYNKIKNNVTCYYIDNDDAIHGSILRDTKYLDNIMNIIKN